MTTAEEDFLKKSEKNAKRENQKDKVPSKDKVTLTKVAVTKYLYSKKLEQFSTKW